MSICVHVHSEATYKLFTCNNTLTTGLKVLRLCITFQLPYMTLTIDTVDGHGLSNEVHHELLPKKTNCISHSFCSKRQAVVQY